MGYNMIGRQGNVNMVFVIDVEIDVQKQLKSKIKLFYPNRCL